MRSDIPVAFPVYDRTKRHFRERTPTGVKPFGSRVRSSATPAQKVTTKTNPPTLGKPTSRGDV
jgi:hypothetical protein